MTRPSIPSIPDFRKELVRGATDFVQMAQRAKSRAIEENRKSPAWSQFTSWSGLGTEITGDPTLFFRIEEGKNITLDTVEKIRKWLERNWPKDEK